jgi:BirA family transcriptional regulator, biotin operon repressor / biotin---[acetyl-CoA-carboxylase] ligase
VFDESGVRARIASTRFAHLRYVPEIDSTNDDAARDLGDPAASGTVILAEYQRHGRGRRGRRWLAPPGSALTFTAVLPQPVPTAALWIVPFWCALAVADGVYSATNIALDLQWPNDLLLRGRKACGILSTSRVLGASTWAACGIGLNVLRPGAGAGEVDPSAAYLTDGAAAVAREDVFVAIVRALDGMLDGLEDTAAIAHTWEHRAGVPGTRYRIQVDGEDAPVEGPALRIGPQGELVIAVGGRERSIALGDARVLREALPT